MKRRCASLRFSLCGRLIRSRCLLLANANVGAEAADIRATRRHDELPMGESLSPEHRLPKRRPVRTSGASPMYLPIQTFRAILCADHESGSSTRRVSASAVSVIGCRPSTTDSTISGARKASRIKRPTGRYRGSDDLAPSFVKRRDRRRRKCFSRRYGSASRASRAKVKK